MKLTKGRIMKLMKKNKQTKKRYRKHPSKRTMTMTKTFRRRKHVNLANMTLKNFGLSGGNDDGTDVSISNTPSVNVGNSLEPGIPVPEGVTQAPEPAIPTPEGVIEAPAKQSGFTSLLKSGVEKVSNTMTNLKDRINASISRSSSPTLQQPEQSQNDTTSTPTPTIPTDASREAVNNAMNTIIQPFANNIADIIVQKLALHNIGATSIDTQMVNNAEIEANS